MVGYPKKYEIVFLTTHENISQLITLERCGNNLASLVNMNVITLEKTIICFEDFPLAIYRPKHCS